MMFKNKKINISLISTIICILFIVWGVQVIKANATEEFVGIEPVFSDNPQYIYELVKPSVSVSLTGTFSPEFQGTVVDGSPIISGITHAALPNETIVFEGSGMSEAEVYMYGMNQEGKGEYKKAEVISNSDTTISAIVNSDFSNGLFLAWVKNKNGISYPVRVNAPMTTYVSDASPQQGDEVHIYGENLTLDDSQNAGVYLVDGQSAVELTIKEANPYCLSVQVPSSVETGDYKLYVYNGSGNEYGWSNPLTISVENSGVIWSGSTINVQTFTDEGIESAISSANDYDTIYFPNGTYIIDKQIKVSKKLRFLGESKEGVKLVCGLTADTVGENTSNNHSFLIQSYPSEFSSLTFEDTVEMTYSPIFIWANAYEVQDSREGFTVINCHFEKKHSYGTLTQKTETVVGKCLSASTVTNVIIQDNQFIAPSGAFVTGCTGIEISDNTAYGTWINDGENGACFMQFTSCNNIAIYQNKVYGQDILTDPDGRLSEGDKTFCRVLAFQLPYGATRNVYIADNEFDRVGGFISNSGELIMFEAIYKLGLFQPTNVSESSLTFSETTWSSVDGAMQVGTHPVQGATIVICNGQGNAQYRKITSVTENTVTVDRPWDILPNSESMIAIINPMENVVLYRNNISGPRNYYTQYNATAGVQAYANMLNFHVKDNVFKNVMTGVRLSSHYYATEQGHFAVFGDTIVEDNAIQDVRNGIMMLLVYDDSEDVFQESEPIVHTSNHTIIRTNEISYARYSTASNLSGIGGDGITVGSEYKAYTNWQPTKIYNGAIVTNTVVENNKFNCIANSNIRMQYNQGNTILRGNDYASGAVSVAYDVSDATGACKVIKPIRLSGIVKHDDKVVFEKFTAEQVASYWSSTEKIAPIKEGYVFGGWYTTTETVTERTETYTENEVDTYFNPLSVVSGEAYAKFVPAQVLNVKAQNESKVNKDYITGLAEQVGEDGLVSDENAFYIRLMSSLDSDNYKKVGFEIYLANWLQVYKDGTENGATETSAIYRGLKVGNETKTAYEIFGGESEYLGVWQLSKINCPANVKLIIYVRPYWITMDGTKVEGLAKYVHIEDEYEGYVSVPVNILNKDVAAKLAAGRVDMKYFNTAGQDVALEFKSLEAGRMLTNMKAEEKDGLIKMVGYGEANQYNDEETLYANVRFKKVNTAEKLDVDVEFAMDMVMFCDWNEKVFTVDEKWDVKYDAQEIVQE